MFRRRCVGWTLSITSLTATLYHSLTPPTSYHPTENINICTKIWKTYSKRNETRPSTVICSMLRICHWLYWWIMDRRTIRISFLIRGSALDCRSCYTLLSSIDNIVLSIVAIQFSARWWKIFAISILTAAHHCANNNFIFCFPSTPALSPSIRLRCVDRIVFQFTFLSWNQPISSSSTDASVTRCHSIFSAAQKRNRK